MAAAMTLGFSSCGSKASEIASKENIYSAQKIEMPEGLDYINQLLYSGDKFYVIGEVNTQEGEGENAVYKSETKMQVVSLEGNMEKEVVLASNDERSNKYIQNIMVGNDGNLVAMESCYEWNETTGESKEDYLLAKFGSDGGLISEQNLKDMTEALKKETGNDYFYVENFLSAADGTLFFSCNGVIAVADSDGKYLYCIKNEEASENTWMNGLYKTIDGKVWTVITSSRQEGNDYITEQKLCEIDTVNRKFGAEYPFEQNGSIMNGTDKYDLLISRDSGLVGYDIETGNTEPIINWIKSGFDSTAMNSNCTTVLPDGRILCVTYDYDYNGGGGYSWSNNDLVINILTEVDPATLPDKKLIKLYALYLDVGVKRQILKFNKDNPEYEIEFTCYQDFAGNNYDDAITKLNNDMISGNLPDIIVLNSYSMPVDSYVSKGLFADLYEFMDKDETMNRSDFLENVFKAYETNGKLYELVPAFYINTIAGKTSEVGENAGWTVDEFIKFAEEHPEVSIFENDRMTRDGFFMNIINNCYSNYINSETGECYFDTDGFIQLLEFSNRFPKEIDYDKMDYDESYWQDRETALREGRALLSMTTLNRFASIREIEQANFGAPVTFKGYPGAAGNGSSLSCDIEVAITSKAANPDGAWEFVKYFLSEEYQDDYANQNAYMFPVRKSSLEKQAQSAKERPYWEDENGEKQYYDNTWYIGGTEIKVGVNTDEDNQRVLDIINSTTAISRYDSNISNIITEETPAFFEGQKSAQEVAKIIQNRVSNYIAENR